MALAKMPFNLEVAMEQEEKKNEAKHEEEEEEEEAFANGQGCLAAETGNGLCARLRMPPRENYADNGAFFDAELLLLLLLLCCCFLVVFFLLLLLLFLLLFLLAPGSFGGLRCVISLTFSIVWASIGGGGVVMWPRPSSLGFFFILPLMCG